MRKTATTIRGILTGCVLFAAGALSASAHAGVALGATRVIYPAGQKQVQLAVTNNDDNSTAYSVMGGKCRWAARRPVCYHSPLFAMQGKREYPAHYRCDQ